MHFKTVCGENKFNPQVLLYVSITAILTTGPFIYSNTTTSNHSSSMRVTQEITSQIKMVQTSILRGSIAKQKLTVKDSMET